MKGADASRQDGSQRANTKQDEGPKGDQAQALAPGSSRQQDALVGPLTPKESRKIAAKRLRLYRFVHLVLRAPVRWILRVRQKGRENVPKRGGAILVVNHVSSFDPPSLLVVLKRPYVTLAKAGILAKPLKRLFVQTLGGMIRVDRSRGGNEAAVQAACQAVKNGKLLAVWPEGGRSPTGHLLRGHTGVARIALETGAPVVPVAVTGTFEKKSKHQKKIRWSVPVTVRFGEPLVYRDRAHEAQDRHAVRAVTDEIMLEVAKLLGSEEKERYHRLLEADVPPGVVPEPDEQSGDGGDANSDAGVADAQVQGFARNR